MRNRLRWIAFLCIALVVSFTGCSSSEPAMIESASGQRETVEHVSWWLDQYLYDLDLAETIQKERLNQQAELLKAGQINTIEFRTRVYQINLIHAHTIHFIDNRPQYAILNTFLWSQNDGEPPSLAWCIPELAADSEKRQAQCEQYFEDFIWLHNYAIDQLIQTLENYEVK